MSKRITGLSSIVFGLYLVLVFSLGLMKPPVDVGFAELTPTDILFPIVFLAWLVGIVAGSCSFQWRREFLIFAIYLLALALSSIFSAKPGLSFARLPGSAYLVLLAVIGPGAVTTLERLRVSILVWVAGAALPLIFGLAGIFLFYVDPGNRFLPDLTYHYGAVPVGNFPRLSSTFVSASMFCNYLTVTFILVLVSARMRWINSLVAPAIVFATGICAIFTVSIGLGGVFLGVGLWVWITTPHRAVARTSLLLGCAAALAFLLIAPFALVNDAGRWFFEELAPSSRLLVWRDALGTFLSDPLTGKGLGTAVADVTFRNSDATWSLLTDAHNTFLSVAAQAGIPGLAAIVAISLGILKAAFGKSAHEKSSDYIRRALGVAFLAAFVYEGLTGSFEEARHLWVLMGLLLAAENIVHGDHGSVALHGT
jgi:O-antigen ligase